MKTGIIGALSVDLYLPGIASLKAKRSILKALEARLQAKFNVAVAEVNHQDVWQTAGISVVTVGNNRRHVERSLRVILQWIETEFHDTSVSREAIEIF